jgi:threonine/homoserine/homoserine lactone efflux protein
MSGVDSAASQMAVAAPFLSTYFVLLATPGPIGLAIASFAALRGLSRTLPLIIGIASGTAALAGVALVVGESLSNFVPTRIMDTLAAATMLVLAVRMALSNPFDGTASPLITGHTGLVATGFLISILDPMIATFFLAGFSGSLRPLADGYSGWTLVLALGIIDLIWFVMIASLMSQSRVRQAVQNWHVPVRMASAVALAGLTVAKLPSILHLG